MRYRYFILIAVIIGLVPACLCVPVFANESDAKQERVIRVGYPDGFRGFFEPQQDGRMSGYAGEYLDKIAERTHWKYEFLSKSWVECLELLKQGEIDLLCNAQYTVQRDEFFDFPDMPTGLEYSLLYVNRSNHHLYYNDIASLNGIRIGCGKGSSRIHDLREYAQLKGFEYEEVIYESVEEMVAALKRDEVDAIALGSLFYVDELKIVAKFKATPFYFMTQEGNVEILNQLNRAMLDIVTESPDFASRLYDKYYAKSILNKQIFLTREEETYIQENKNIVVGCYVSRNPFCYIDETGKIKGIAIDLLELISRKCGLDFTYVSMPLGTRAIDYLTTTDAKLVAGLLRTDALNFSPDLVYSESLMKSTLALVGRQGEPFDPNGNFRFVLQKAFLGGSDYVKSVYPNASIMIKENNEACLDAIVDGEADIMIEDVYVIRQLKQKPRYDTLSTIPAYLVDEFLCYVTDKGENPILMSIITKAIAQLSPDDIERVIINNTIAKPYNLTVEDILYKFRMPLVAINILFVACVSLLIIVILLRQKNLRSTQAKNCQLEEAILKAEAAGKAKEDFLADMSHEIRTPITAIIGLNEIAEANMDDKSCIRDCINKIKISAKHLLSLINDILDMSKIDAGKMELDCQAFCLQEIIETIDTVYKGVAQEHHVELSIESNLGDHTCVFGDLLRLKQVLINLISNAIKYNKPQGKVVVSIEQLDSTEKIKVRFSVADTGIGIKASELQTVFNVFERSSSNALAVNGTGLGLAISRELVSMMQGELHV